MGECLFEWMRSFCKNVNTLMCVNEELSESWYCCVCEEVWHVTIGIQYLVTICVDS